MGTWSKVIVYKNMMLNSLIKLTLYLDKYICFYIYPTGTFQIKEGEN
jgi:hypothetical protein